MFQYSYHTVIIRTDVRMVIIMINMKAVLKHPCQYTIEWFSNISKKVKKKKNVKRFLSILVELPLLIGRIMYVHMDKNTTRARKPMIL